MKLDLYLQLEGRNWAGLQYNDVQYQLGKVVQDSKAFKIHDDPKPVMVVK